KLSTARLRGDLRAAPPRPARLSRPGRARPGRDRGGRGKDRGKDRARRRTGPGAPGRSPLRPGLHRNEPRRGDPGMALRTGGRTVIAYRSAIIAAATLAVLVTVPAGLRAQGSVSGDLAAQVARGAEAY